MNRAAGDAGSRAARIGHELNDVFTALLALSDFTATNLPADASVREDVEGIRELATRGAQLVQELVALDAGSSRGPTETILVVEDEAPVRSVICRSLGAAGYTVLEAENGEAALDVAERHDAPIHLVITDVVMPEMSGTDLYDHLRRWYPSMRILFISGNAKGSIPAEALQEGTGVAFLAKPLSVDHLNAEVRRMLDAATASIQGGA